MYVVGTFSISSMSTYHLHLARRSAGFELPDFPEMVNLSDDEILKPIMTACTFGVVSLLGYAVSGRKGKVLSSKLVEVKWTLLRYDFRILN